MTVAVQTYLDLLNELIVNTPHQLAVAVIVVDMESEANLALSLASPHLTDEAIGLLHQLAAKEMEKRTAHGAQQPHEPRQ